MWRELMHNCLQTASRWIEILILPRISKPIELAVLAWKYSSAGETRASQHYAALSLEIWHKDLPVATSTENAIDIAETIYTYWLVLRVTLALEKSAAACFRLIQSFSSVLTSLRSVPAALQGWDSEWLWMESFIVQCLQQTWYVLERERSTATLRGEDAKWSQWTEVVKIWDMFGLRPALKAEVQVPWAVFLRQDERLQNWLKLRRLQMSLQYQIANYLSRINHTGSVHWQLDSGGEFSQMLRSDLAQIIEFLPRYKPELVPFIGLPSDELFPNFAVPPKPLLLGSDRQTIEYLSLYHHAILVNNTLVCNNPTSQATALDSAVALCRILVTRKLNLQDDGSNFKDIFLAGVLFKSTHHKEGITPSVINLADIRNELDNG